MDTVVCSTIEVVGVLAIAAASLNVLWGRPGDGVGATGARLRRRMAGEIVVVDVNGDAALGIVDVGSIFCSLACMLLACFV